MKVKTPEYVEISSDSDLYIKRDIDGTSLVVGVHDFEIPDPLTLHNGLISEDNPSRFSAGLYATEITLGDIGIGYLTSDRTATKLGYKDGYSIEVKSKSVKIKDSALTELLSVGSYSDSAYLDVNCPIRPNSYFTTIKTPDISGKEDSGKIEFTFDDATQVGVISFYLYRDTSNTYSLVGHFSDDGFFTDSIQSDLIGTLDNRVSDIYVNTIHALNYDGLPSGQVSTVDRLIVNGSTKLQAETDRVQVYTDLVHNQHLSLGASSDSWSDGYIDTVYVNKIKFKGRASYMDLYIDPESGDSETNYDFILEGNFLQKEQNYYTLGNLNNTWNACYTDNIYVNKVSFNDHNRHIDIYPHPGPSVSNTLVSSGSLIPSGDYNLGDPSYGVWANLYVSRLHADILSDNTCLAIANMLLDSNRIGSIKMIMIPSNVVKSRGDVIDAPYVWDFSMGWMSDDSGFNIKRDTSGWTQHSLNGTWKALNSYGGGALSYYVVLAVRIA
jgi:hypothetical protein